MAAQAGLYLAWSETPEDTFCRVGAQNLINNEREHFSVQNYRINSFRRILHVAFWK